MNGYSYASRYTPVRDKAQQLRANVADHLDNMRPAGLIALTSAACAAIESCNLDRWDDMVQLPDGITINGKNRVPAGIVVANLKLDVFLDLGD